MKLSDKFILIPVFDIVDRSWCEVLLYNEYNLVVSVQVQVTCMNGIEQFLTNMFLELHNH